MDENHPIGPVGTRIDVYTNGKTMARWGTRWGLDWATRQEVGAVANTVRVGGRYVTSTKGKPRPIGAQGEKMRSGWEANYSYFLAYLGIPYQYEVRRFIFEPIISGTRCMIPDFYLPKTDEFHEVKGYFDRRSRTQLKRLAKYYPEVRLIVIDARFFQSIERQRLCRVIPQWRCRHTRGETHGR
jgi:hypothetical protein